MTTEFITAADGVKIAWERLGVACDAPLAVLVHGFGSSRGQNWKSTGWYSTLTEAGFAIVAMDLRGHGMSDKPRDPASYGHERMAGDVSAVMDAAGAARRFGLPVGPMHRIEKAKAFHRAVMHIFAHRLERMDAPDVHAIHVHRRMAVLDPLGKHKPRATG